MLIPSPTKNRVTKKSLTTPTLEITSPLYGRLAMLAPAISALIPGPTLTGMETPVNAIAMTSRLPPRNTMPKHQPTAPTRMSSGDVAIQWNISGRI